MSVVPTGISHVSNLMQSSLLTSQITGTQTQLLTIENELSTGLAVSTPSDNPAAAAIIMQLQQTLNRQASYNDTINGVSAQMSQTDTSLGNLTTLLQQAEQIASADVGSDVARRSAPAMPPSSRAFTPRPLPSPTSKPTGNTFSPAPPRSTQPFVESNGVVEFVGKR